MALKYEEVELFGAADAELQQKYASITKVIVYLALPLSSFFVLFIVNRPIYFSFFFSFYPTPFLSLSSLITPPTPFLITG